MIDSGHCLWRSLVDRQSVCHGVRREEEEEEEEEDTSAFGLPCSVGCCPRIVSIGPMLFLYLLLNVALDRRPV